VTSPQRVALPTQPEVTLALRPCQRLRGHTRSDGGGRAPSTAWLAAGAAVWAGGAGFGKGSAMNRRSRTSRFIAAACR
jgi:hypothetical protein